MEDGGESVNLAVEDDGTMFDETGDVVAAVSASGPTARIVDERVGPPASLVLVTARAISSEMGTAARAR